MEAAAVLMVGEAATVATATTAATAATTGLFGAAGGVTAAGLISGSLTTLGVLSAIGGGQAEESMFELRAKQEELRGAEESLKIKKSLLATMASQNASYAARGIDIGSGSPLTVKKEAEEEAEHQLNISRSNVEAEKEALRMEGRAARAGGLLSAAGMAGSFAAARLS